MHREAAAQFDEAPGRSIEDEAVVRASGRGNATGLDEEKLEDDELQLVSNEEEPVEYNKDGNESRLPDDDDAEIRHAIAEVKERLNDDEKKAEGDVGEILTFANLKGGEEMRDSGDSGAQETPGDAGERKVPDAIAFLERLAMNLTKGK